MFLLLLLCPLLHLIWRIKAANGKETSQGSFLKYTAHEFRKKLLAENIKNLEKFKVDAANKSHEFWQRDLLAIHLYTKEVAYQKLEYIHANPVSKHWKLANEPCEYYYSTARFYENGIKEFDFIKDLRDEF